MANAKIKYRGPHRNLLSFPLRWDIELGFRDLKTTMAMEELRCRPPAMARKELLAYLVALRCLEAEAATRHGVPRHRISFKGTFHAAMFRARSKRKSKELRDRLIEIIALDLVPERPGRREPRAWCVLTHNLWVLARMKIASEQQQISA